MMTYLEFRSKLGAAAHEDATRQYIAQRQGRHLFHHDKLRIPNPPRDFSVRKLGGPAPIGNAILRKDLNDPYLGILIMCLQTRRDPAWPLEYSEPGKARQPDLACIELHEVYEIKPDDPQQINDGRQQLVDFINLLSAGDREWGIYSKNSPNTYGSALGRQTAGLTWARGLSFRPQPATVAIPSLGEVAITYRSGEAGIIVWHTNSERERIPEPAMVVGKELANQLRRSMVVTEELALHWAKQALEALPQLVPVLQRLLRLVGLAMAVVLLLSAISLIFVQAPAAILFAVCLAVCLRALDLPSQPRGIRLT